MLRGEDHCCDHVDSHLIERVGVKIIPNEEIEIGLNEALTQESRPVYKKVKDRIYSVCYRVYKSLGEII